MIHPVAVGQTVVVETSRSSQVAFVRQLPSKIPLFEVNTMR